jgi:GntR family transcriptional repressor for pyruvate dehydrogenase complex
VASGNPILAALMETMTPAIYDKRVKTVARAKYLQESAAIHREIYRAVRAHEPQEARRLMEQHLRTAETAEKMEGSTASILPARTGLDAEAS